MHDPDVVKENEGNSMKFYLVKVYISHKTQKDFVDLIPVLVDTPSEAESEGWATATRKYDMIEEYSKVYGVYLITDRVASMGLQEFVG